MSRFDDLREAYLSFFESKGHVRLASDSLVPRNDPTVMFTGAGMNQFKDMFMGRGTLPHKRVTTAQKCLRTQDLDIVGRTPFHHTYFEMMGNFSFGDYFRHETIAWAWEFITQQLPKHFKRGVAFDTNRLRVSVHLDDHDAASYWHNKVGIQEDRIYALNDKANYWPAGAPSKGIEGTCGPCSEIFWDMFPERGLARDPQFEDDPDRRWCEFWNLVFTDQECIGVNQLRTLPLKNIDTGAGLIRILAIAEGVRSSWETSLFAPRIQQIGNMTGKTYEPASKNPVARENAVRMRRIADHTQAALFVIGDGVRPGRDKAPYVLRKIIRRAITDGRELGLTPNDSLVPLLEAWSAEYKNAYPNVVEDLKKITEIFADEERGYWNNLERGMKVLEGDLAKLGAGETLSAEDTWRIYETYGLPVEVIRDHAESRGQNCDVDGFHAILKGQKLQDVASKGKTIIFQKGPLADIQTAGTRKTSFLGYEELQSNAQIAGIVPRGADLFDLAQSLKPRATDVGLDDRLAPVLKAGEYGVIVTDRSPFYGTSGGQIGDTGRIVGPEGEGEISICSKQEDFILHPVKVTRGQLSRNDRVTLIVDGPRRAGIRHHHTATHLLHAALRTILGDHVEQQGSLVMPDYLRFDFSHTRPLSEDEIDRVEDWVNHEIQRGTPAEIEEMPIGRAREAGAMALFGEKYGDTVRVLTIAGEKAESGPSSIELCGGTHVSRTSEIGFFQITSQEALAAGVRRITAVAGEPALRTVQATRHTINALTQALNTGAGELRTRVDQLQGEIKSLQKELAKLKREAAGSASEAVIASAEEINGAKLVVSRQDGLDADGLLSLMDEIKGRIASGVFLLASASGPDTIALVLAATKDRVKAGFHAGKTLGPIAKAVGGGGGGKPEMARAGGKDVGALDAVLADAAGVLRKALAG